jgi:hypothetical protein
MGWTELRDPSTNHMVGRIDPARRLLEVKRKKGVYLIDLSPYLQENGTQPTVAAQEQPQARE